MHRRSITFALAFSAVSAAPAGTSAPQATGASPRGAPLPCPVDAVLIPAAASVRLGGWGTAWPEHPDTISAFCIDIHEFTFARLGPCANAGACVPFRFQNECGTVVAPTRSVTCVNVSEAAVDCEAHHGLLPTEAQWEYAARGTDRRPYPWGTVAPTSQNLAIAEWSSQNGEPPDRSPFGVAQLAYGAAEWTSTIAPPATTDHHIAKGAKTYVHPAFYRESVDDLTRDGHLGFRCVYPIGTKLPTFGAP